MKMMSSTSITSTIGVTLISLIGCAERRRARRLESAPPSCRPAPMVQTSCSLVDLARQNGCELVGKAFEPRRVARNLAIEFVVENYGRNSGEQAERGGEQSLGDAGRNHCKARVLA